MHFTKNVEVINKIHVSGTGAWNTTLSATAAADNGDGTVRLKVAADIFAAGSTVYIEGTTNYNGMRYVKAVPTGYIDIKADFTAETPAGTETVKIAIDPGGDAMFKGLKLHITVAPTTSEDMTITFDANAGSAYDVVIYDEDLTEQSVKNLVWYPAEPIILDKDDLLRFAWTNSDSRTYGMTLEWIMA